MGCVAAPRQIPLDRSNLRTRDKRSAITLDRVAVSAVFRGVRRDPFHGEHELANIGKDKNGKGRVAICPIYYVSTLPIHG